MRFLRTAAFAASLFLPSAFGQIVRLADMNTTQIAALDRAHTVVILTDGIMEEHGPYLPSYTDGFIDESLTQDLARAVIAKLGWTAAIFPVIPLGTNPANVIGKRYSFPGSFTVSQASVRSIYMDLADSFGEQGFRWVFIVDSHGGPTQSIALDAASEYFHDTYHGTMTHLLGAMRVFDCCHDVDKTLPKQQFEENGMSVHADLVEQSMLMFVRGDLADIGVRVAKSNGAGDVAGLMAQASKQNWPGYLGAPRYATAAIGAAYYGALSKAMCQLADEVLSDKTDPYKLERYGPAMFGATTDLESAMLRHEAEQRKRHEAWLAAHPTAIAQ